MVFKHAVNPSVDARRPCPTADGLKTIYHLLAHITITPKFTAVVDLAEAPTVIPEFAATDELARQVAVNVWDLVAAGTVVRFSNW